jgi:hypothetical protein
LDYGAVTPAINAPASSMQSNASQSGIFAVSHPGVKTSWPDTVINEAVPFIFSRARKWFIMTN